MVSGGINRTLRQLNITTGKYTGNNTQNRAVAHSLQRIPKLVLVFREASNGEAVLTTEYPTRLVQCGTNLGSCTVTTMNATSFYVGDAGFSEVGMNINAQTYHWVAFG
jgi:hypothetical protein